MSSKKFILLSVLTVSVATGVANATTYVSDGKSFASLANSDRTNNNTFEAFTRNVVLHRQSNDSVQSNQSDDTKGNSPGVAKEDTGLMLLISGVLIALQLRRKQKSLPNQQLLSMNAEG